MRLLVFALMLLVSAPVLAQSPFAPRVLVNDGAITNYEVEQRAKFLGVLRAVGDLDAQAVDRLIEDRLRLDAAKAASVKITEKQVTDGETEFAARASLSREAFLAELASEGIAPATLRDFVSAGIAWREVVRARFSSLVRVTDEEVDRALSPVAKKGAVRVLLSELILPATPEFVGETRPLSEELARTLRGPADFAEAARRYSAAPSRDRGGEIDWLPLANLPPQLGQAILKLRPGAITPPVDVPNAIALFLLRGIEDLPYAAPAGVSVDYATVLLPAADARAEAARLRGAADTCDDLYQVAPGVARQTLPVAEVPADLALALAPLDPGESTTSLARGGAAVFAMLCGRVVAADPQPTREEVRNQLLNARLGAYAETWLAELRADAFIRTP